MPDHEPVLELRVCPTVGVPEITGSTVFTGGRAATTLVIAEVAEDAPAALLAVTITRSVVATSLGDSA